MDRRTVIGGMAAAGLVAGSPSVLAAGRRSKPNFLFIMADDMGYADLSCYGRDDYSTPHIDALARRGMQFTNAYSNSAVCTATRVGLITGRYQYRVPIGLEEPLGNRPIGLDPSQPNIASELRKAGYATSLIGKWHMGSLPNYGPLQSGYDEFWGFRSGGIDYFTHKDAAGRPDLWDGDTRIEEAGYMTDLLGDRAISSLGGYAKSKQPFFMSLHFSAPHWPWEGLDDESEARRLEAKRGFLALMHTDGGTMKTYAEMVMRLDIQVGRIVAALKRLRLDRDTVIVFTSDNGGERFSKTWPFSGRKSELLEGGIRVPCVVVWPGLTKPKAKSDVPIMSMDWMPTFLAAAGGSSPAGHALDGVDIRTAISGGQIADRPLFWRYKNHAQEAMRLGQWKYLKMAGHSYLFDLAADPMERADLKGREPARFAAMQAAWNAWNATMLPIDPESTSHGFDADSMAERYGISPH